MTRLLPVLLAIPLLFAGCEGDPACEPDVAVNDGPEGVCFPDRD